MAFFPSVFEPVVNPLLLVRGANGGLDRIAKPKSAVVDGATVNSPLGLQVLYTDAGVLFCPMTTAQRTALSDAGGLADGTEVYDITLHAKFVWANGAWDQLGGAHDTITLADGTESAPSLRFSDDLQTGIYSSALGSFDITTFGKRTATFSHAGGSDSYMGLEIVTAGPEILALGSALDIDLLLSSKRDGAVKITGETNKPGLLLIMNEDNTHFVGFTYPLAANIDMLFQLPSTKPTFGAIPLLVDPTGGMMFDNDGAIQHIRVQVPTASVKTMRATPFQIFVAPGATRRIILHKCMLRMKYESVAYTGGGAINIIYGNSGVSSIETTIDAALLAGATADSMVTVSGRVVEVDSSVVLNTALKITCATAEFATGNSDLYVDLWYSIVEQIP